MKRGRINLQCCKAVVERNVESFKSDGTLQRKRNALTSLCVSLKAISTASYECDPEAAKGYNALKAADYWWGCSTKNPAPYRAHAVPLYRRAISEGLVDGLVKTVVERRIAEVESTNAGGSASRHSHNHKHRQALLHS